MLAYKNAVSAEMMIGFCVFSVGCSQLSNTTELERSQSQTPSAESGGGEKRLSGLSSAYYFQEAGDREATRNLVVSALRAEPQSWQGTAGIQRRLLEHHAEASANRWHSNLSEDSLGAWQTQALDTSLGCAELRRITRNVVDILRRHQEQVPNLKALPSDSCVSMRGPLCSEAPGAYADSPSCTVADTSIDAIDLCVNDRSIHLIAFYRRVLDSLNCTDA